MFEVLYIGKKITNYTVLMYYSVLQKFETLKRQIFHQLNKA
jgi:hypothetical protein